jgi:hypothetical protein
MERASRSLCVEITVCTEHTDLVKNISLSDGKTVILANVIHLAKCALDLSEHSHVR